MSGFRIGDRAIEIAGVRYRLRLSVSALAEMAVVFEAESPKALAARLRKATVTDWNRVLRCVAAPPLTTPVGREDMLQIMPELSALIADGLRA